MSLILHAVIAPLLILLTTYLFRPALLFSFTNNANLDLELTPQLTNENISINNLGNDSVSSSLFPRSHPNYPNYKLLNSTTTKLGNTLVVGELHPPSQYSHPLRYLRINRSLIGGVWMVNDWPSIYQNFVIQQAFHQLDGFSSKCSVALMGLGIGSAISSGPVKEDNITIVELEREIHENAVSYFDLDPTVDIKIQDALQWAELKDNKFNVFIHDFFASNYINHNLFSVQFFEKLLAQKAVQDAPVMFVINFFASHDSVITKALVRTTRQVFPSCALLHDQVTQDFSFSASTPCNFVLFCSTNPKQQWRFLPPSTKNQLSSGFHNYILHTLNQRIVPEIEYYQSLPEHFVISDDNDPFESIRDQEVENHIALMDQVLPSEVWDFY